MNSETMKAIRDFDVAAYVEGYEFRGDEGDYQPNGMEQELLTDAISGVISEFEQAIHATGGVGAEPVDMEWLRQHGRNFLPSGECSGINSTLGEKLIAAADEIDKLRAAASPAIPADHVVREQDRDVPLKYHRTIETLIELVTPTALGASRRAEFEKIAEEHRWDGLSCACGGGWLLGHASGCPEAAPASPPVGDGDEAFPSLDEAFRAALKATEVYYDAASVEETNWTGWGDQTVPPAAEMRRVKAKQALTAIRDSDPGRSAPPSTEGDGK